MALNTQSATTLPQKNFAAATMGVVMNPIAEINPDKDTTLGLLEAAQRRGWNLMYFEPNNLYLRDGCTRGYGKPLSVTLDRTDWFRFDDEEHDMAMNTLAVILMRVDPPVDLEFLNICHLLQAASRDGTLVVNNPVSLHCINEKIFAQQFAHLSPPTIVSKCRPQLIDFAREYNDVVLKPLNQMGGTGIIRISTADASFTQAIDSATDYGKCTIIAQQTIKDYARGDKRILMIDGEPVEKALLRVPPPGQFCANLAAGGRGEGVGLNEHDKEICRRIRPALIKMDLLFVGIDVIAGYLTEINVTSPTCMRELNRLYMMDIGNDVIAAIESKLTQ